MGNIFPDLRGIKVCLVFPPYRESRDTVFLTSAKKNLGKIPPLSLCAVAAALERHGCGVQIIDANASETSIDEAVRKIEHFDPDFFGFTLSTYQFHFTLEWIRRIRLRLNIPVIVGGPHVRIYPAEILTHREIDYCVIGDAEETLPLLLHALVNKDTISGIDGIAYRNGSGETVTGPASYAPDLDAVAFPARHLLDNSLYYSLISQYKNFTAMTSSRGCVFGCTFCDNHCIPYRAMSPRRVVDEIQMCVKEFGIKEIDMFDGVFSVERARLLQICEEIKNRGIRVHWSLRTRTDLVDRESLRALAQAGCTRIYYGIESGSPEILRNIKKGTDPGRVKEALLLTKRAGIETFGFFMIGAPGETTHTAAQTARLLARLPLDYVQIAPIFYPPQTALYAEIVRETQRDYWREYTIAPEKDVDFPLVGTSLTRKEIHALARKMYLKFYLRPRSIIRFIMKMKSCAEVPRALGALSDMFKEKA
jgi:anaerobic magnesium-protoporphyrin IX monomethyl ester cyclase